MSAALFLFVATFIVVYLLLVGVKTPKKTVPTSSKALIALHRAAGVAQEAFYAWSKAFFDSQIDAVTTSNTSIVVVLSPDNDQPGHIVPFPMQLFGDNPSCHAVLSTLNDDDGVGLAHVLIEALIPSLAGNITLVRHIIHNPTRTVILRKPDEDDFENDSSPHSVIYTTLDNGKGFIIDITGAQYGNSNPVTPFDVYAFGRIEEIEDYTYLQPTSHLKAIIRARQNSATPPKSREEEFAKMFGVAVEDWGQANGGLTELLESEEEEFVNKKPALMRFIQDKIMERKGEMIRRGLAA